MRRMGATRVSVLVGLMLAALGLSAFADATLERAKQLLVEREPKQAYDMLAPLEPQRAGDPEFDYLLGIAALDSGEVERAIFALERVLAVQPDNALARAEIARAYYLAGERDTARREFENVKQEKIPEKARETVDRYLSAIAASEVTRVQAYFEMGIGSDSNVNAATASSQIAIPSLGGVIATLNPGATQNSDLFTGVAGGLNFTHKTSGCRTTATATPGAESRSGSTATMSAARLRGTCSTRDCITPRRTYATPTGISRASAMRRRSPGPTPRCCTRASTRGRRRSGTRNSLRSGTSPQACGSAARLP